jgi:hypothetical protein
MITQELALHHFDYKDGELYWKNRTSNRNKLGQKAGSPDQHGYVNICFNYKKHKMHRIIFLMHHGYLPKEIDHIDGNPQNNAIENLRPANRSEQLCNTKLRKNNNSGVKGVCWDKAKQKWMVRVNKDKKNVYMGRFDDFELAELVAIEARNKYHGEYAWH